MSRAEVQSMEKMAEAGNAKAQFNLALIYESRNGIEPDEEKSLKWYKEAAKYAGEIPHLKSRENSMYNVLPSQ